MKIKAVKAYWEHIPIAPEKQHASDFGRIVSFPVRDGLVEIPDRPGLGITVREDFLVAHAVAS